MNKTITTAFLILALAVAGIFSHRPLVQVGNVTVQDSFTVDVKSR